MKTHKTPEPESQDTRQAILQAATRLFAQKGITGVSVKEIAQAAGANPALLFYYFQNKQQLYSSLIQEAGVFVSQGFEKLLKEKKDPLKKLTQALDFFLDTLQNHPDLVRMAVREMYGFGELNPEQLLEMQRLAVSPFEEIIRQGIQQGVFRAVDPKIAAISILNLAHFFTGRHLILESMPRKAAARNILDIVVTGILQRD